MSRSAKPRHAHKPRLIKIPMTAGLHDQFGMALHAAFAALSVAPDRDQFDNIAQYFNVIGLAIEHDARFKDEALILNSGASAMQQIDGGWRRTGVLRPTALELLPVRNAINICDEILPRIDVTRLHLAQVQLANLRINESREVVCSK